MSSTAPARAVAARDAGPAPRGGPLVVPRTLTLLLLLLAVLVALYPLWGGWALGEKQEFFLQKLTSMMIFAVFAMSLDLLVGMTGLVSLGHAAFFGVAGYALALLSPEYAAANIWVVLPEALGIAAAAALVIGAVCIRTAGVYFIMVTLAFGQMLFYFFFNSTFAGGSDGMFVYVKPAVAIGGTVLLDLDHKQTLFYVAFAAMIAVYLLLRMILRAPFGHVILGIRANETRVRALGYNTTLYKLVSFVIAGTIAGLAGFLFATQYGFVNPSLIGWHTSGEVLMMVILGGMGTLFGPILGAFAFELLRYGFEALTEHWLLLMGGVIIAVVLLLPKGLAGLLLALTGARSHIDPSLSDD